MKIGILGSGNMGAALSTRFTAAGHDISMTARDLDKAREVASKISPKVTVVEPSQVSEGVDLIVNATYYNDSPEALRGAGDLSGKIVVDITNPITPDMSGLVVGHTTSSAEELAKQFPQATFLKAFNTVFAPIWLQGPDFGQGRTAQTLYCGDDENAKQILKSLIDSTGFEGIDCGPLYNARLLEPMGLLIIYLAFGAGHGTQFNATFISRPEAEATKAA